MKIFQCITPFATIAIAIVSKNKGERAFSAVSLFFFLTKLQKRFDTNPTMFSKDV